jgi:hypothetical protein
MSAHGAMVSFTYLDREGIADRQFQAWCDFLPRVGEKVFPQEGQKGSVIVRQIGYRFVRDSEDEPFYQIANVLLGDQDSVLPVED